MPDSLAVQIAELFDEHHPPCFGDWPGSHWSALRDGEQKRAYDRWYAKTARGRARRRAASQLRYARRRILERRFCGVCGDFVPRAFELCTECRYEHGAAVAQTRRALLTAEERADERERNREQQRRCRARKAAQP